MTQHPRRACSILPPGIPHRGWYWLDVEDTGETESFCMSCGKDDIRYVHFIEHKDCPDRLEVGCVCVEFMTDQGAEAKTAETVLKNADARWKNYPKRVARINWTDTQRGNLKCKFDGRLIIIVKSKFGPHFSIGVQKANSNQMEFSTLKLATIQAAKDAIAQSLLRNAARSAAPSKNGA